MKHANWKSTTATGKKKTKKTCILTGWWFGTSILFSHILILGIIIPIDFHIFQRGWNHQPDIDVFHQPPLIFRDASSHPFRADFPRDFPRGFPVRSTPTKTWRTVSSWCIPPVVPRSRATSMGPHVSRLFWRWIDDPDVELFRGGFCYIWFNLMVILMTCFFDFKCDCCHCCFVYFLKLIVSTYLRSWFHMIYNHMSGYS